MSVATVKKQGAGYNAQKMGKLENETEELSHKKVGGEVKKAIMQGSPREEDDPGPGGADDQRETPDYPGV